MHMSSAKPSTKIGNYGTSRNLFYSVKIVISSLTKFFLVRKARKIENIRLHTWQISQRLSDYIILMYEVRVTALKVHKIKIFFGFDFEICIISLLVMSKY